MKEQYTDNRLIQHFEMCASIEECSKSTCYGPVEIFNMKRTAHWILMLMHKIKDKEVIWKEKNNKNEIVERSLMVKINKISPGHNDCMIFSDPHSLSWIKKCIAHSVIYHNFYVINKVDELINIRVTGNGYGTGILCSYENHTSIKCNDESKTKKIEEIVDFTYLQHIVN